jgi:hypothetical protein
MQSVDAGGAGPCGLPAHGQLLVESQGPPGPSTVSRFLRVARHIAATEARTDLFLIDDGVEYAVDPRGEVAVVLDAGGRVWADEVSLSEHGIKTGELAPGIVVAGLDAITEQLFDPAVRVVWH